MIPSSASSMFAARFKLSKSAGIPSCPLYAITLEFVLEISKYFNSS
jgi:hypothetical protein